MKSFTQKALALAAATVCGSTAMAATVTATGGATQFAAETMTSTTAVKVPNLVLTMGVSRTAAQDFTVVIKPVGGTKFDAASCSLTDLTNAAYTGAGAVTLSVKRASTTECAYEVDVTTATSVNDTITFSNLQINSHGLATVGGSESATLGIFDLGETARIDSSADITIAIAGSQRATSLTATADTQTVIDVDHASGALFGFKASGAGATADDATNAIAKFDVNINASLKDPAGNAVTNAIITQINFTVSGDFSGLANFSGGGSTVRVENTNAGTNATATVTVAGAAGAQTATFSATGAQLSAAGTATSVYVKLASLKTASLGVQRDYGVSAIADPSATGVADFSLATANATWWQMRANAIELRSAFFNNDNSAGNYTRFFFQNLGSSVARYTATCQAESGVTVTYGTRSGDLAVGTTMLNAADICTFSTGKRGSITFVINAKAANVKGVYQQAVNGLSAGYIALERPYGDPAGAAGSVY